MDDVVLYPHEVHQPAVLVHRSVLVDCNPLSDKGFDIRPFNRWWVILIIEAIFFPLGEKVAQECDSGIYVVSPSKKESQNKFIVELLDGSVPLSPGEMFTDSIDHLLFFGENVILIVVRLQLKSRIEPVKCLLFL